MIARWVALVAVAAVACAPTRGAAEPPGAPRNPPLHLPPVARYNDPGPRGPADPRVRPVDALVQKVAAELGHRVPVVDGRLAAAARRILAAVDYDARPSNEFILECLWLEGIVEPPPHVILIQMSAGADEEMLAELRGQLPSALGQGRYRRFGAGVVERGDNALVMILLQESFLELAPLPRALLSGGPAQLAGRLLEPYTKPAVLVTAPDGQVARLPLSGAADGFRATFHCGPARGRYKVEVTGEDRFGTTVLANFPIYCGREAPREASARPTSASAPGSPFRSVEEAEAAVARLVNADRARHGLPPLALDPALSRVARGHSEDMRRNGFVGHVSPTTGSAADRLRRAGVDAQLILENVARASSPEEAEGGLMESPGHRANILNRDVTRIGVGVDVTDEVGGDKELFVTQVFTKPLDAADGRAAAELFAELARFRRARGLGALGRDRALDDAAQATAAEMGRAGSLSAGQGLVDKALGKLAARYAQVRTLAAAVGGVSQVVGGMERGLSDPGVTDVGIGLALGRRADGSRALYAVVLLASRR